MNTLEEIVDFYNNTSNFVRKQINIDSSLAKQLELSLQEKVDLVNFMKTVQTDNMPIPDFEDFNKKLEGQIVNLQEQ